MAKRRPRKAKSACLPAAPKSTSPHVFGPGDAKSKREGSPGLDAELASSAASATLSLDAHDPQPMEPKRERRSDELQEKELSITSSDPAAAGASVGLATASEAGDESSAPSSPGPSSTATSSSSDGETSALWQHAKALQMRKRGSMKTISEAEGEPVTSEREVRRSGRKRRAVDVLSPSETPQKKRAAATKKLGIKAALRGRPAAAEVAALRAAAAAKEKKRSVPTSKPKKRLTVKTKGPQGLLSPVQDEQKKTPRKSRVAKTRRSLEATYGYETTDFETRYVAELITELYEEQEQDDRSMYCIRTETVRAETSECKRSSEVEELSLEEFRRMLTYGEVSVESVSSTILPFLRLEEDDVFFDLGCGTGKILVQVALQTPCRSAVGIELMQNRVQEGQKALKRLEERGLPALRGKRLEVLQGDICAPPESARLMDATVVFINNVMFGPTLMLKVMALLKDMAKLRRVVMLRKICERHGHEKCTRAGNYCVEYVHPPQEAEIDVSWADKTSVYLYEDLDYSVRELTRQMTQGGAAQATRPRAIAKKTLQPPASLSKLQAKLELVAQE
ncbi:hypothetical protein BBJ28_00012668 [Nothophytophthora sp. Chile5]|nr:hypothetical protein BBJ28_00012668 [Nothophytophthora sp. Chile5]